MNTNYIVIHEAGRDTYVLPSNKFGITLIEIISIIPAACYEIVVKSGKRTVLRRTVSLDAIDAIKTQLLHDIDEDLA